MYPRLTGPSERDDGLTQLKLGTVVVAVGVRVVVGDGEAVAEGEGVAVSVDEGVGVVPERKMVKFSSALR